MTAPYLIVLGAAVWPGGVASPTLERRARHAAALALQSGGTIITTGGLGKHPPTEADVAAAICASLGVPRDRILTETLSTTTYENLAFAKRLMPAGTRAVIVTDYYHLPRALLTAWALGINASGAFPRYGLRQTPPHRHLRFILREVLALPVYGIKLLLRRVLGR